MREITVLKYSFPFCNCPITLLPLCVMEINALCCKDLLDPMNLFIYLDGGHLRTRHRPPINRSHQIRAMGIQSNCGRAFFLLWSNSFLLFFPLPAGLEVQQRKNIGLLSRKSTACFLSIC
ncbi:hypothetical protein CEXT_633641 [Caerostris extrusa]|uniref:Uncharacterized protein n=1 Tax=Caerostris extrusa TaxID=172846 RepID=A0AAV4RI67_CAEEX|nr:hypothetical protein CEXT_633641 [Caerostris extrusa]